MHEFLLNLTTWITNHPNLAGFAIFASSFAESLAFVGLIMPGAALMMTAGALITTGVLISFQVCPLFSVEYCPFPVDNLENCFLSTPYTRRIERKQFLTCRGHAWTLKRGHFSKLIDSLSYWHLL